jgi:hypothetical protein
MLEDIMAVAVAVGLAMVMATHNRLPNSKARWWNLHTLS